MKKLAYSIVVAAVMLFGFNGCRKNVNETPAAPTAPDSFQEIVVPESFKWSTSKKINFSFAGSSVDDSKIVLKVLDPDGAIIFQKLQKYNEDYKAVIEVPAHVKTLTVNYGGISENIDCTSGNVTLKLN